MTLYRIKVNNTIYECFDVVYNDCFYATLKSDDEKAVVDIFNNATEIIVMNEIGQVIKTVTDIGKVVYTKTIYDYYADAEGVLRPVVQIQLKTFDVNEKIRNIEKKLDTSINEAAMTIEEYIDYKVKLIGEECKAAIYNGADVETSKGIQHFSYTSEDQRNLKTLFDSATITKLDVPYHSDGNACEIYTWEDIVKIYVALQSNLLYQTTYCNALNTYIRSLSDKATIASVVYGQEIPEEQKVDMELALAKGQTIMNTLLSAYGLESISV